MRTSFRLLLPFSLVVMASCAPAGTAGGNVQPGRSGSGAITAEEIAGMNSAATAYQLVQSLRPQWVRPRGMQSLSESTHTRAVGSGKSSSGDVAAGQGPVTVPNAGQPQVLVYVGNARMGDVSALKTISAADVGSIEYLEPAKATLRFGGGHSHGVILVTTRTR